MIVASFGAGISGVIALTLLAATDFGKNWLKGKKRGEEA